MQMDEVHLCPSCGAQNVLYLDGVLVCESCGVADESHAHFVESHLSPYPCPDQQEPSQQNRKSSEECMEEMIEMYGMAIRVNQDVRYEAKCILKEVKDAEGKLRWRFSHKLCSGVGLFLAARKKNFPVTTQEVSMAIGVKHKYFLRSLRYFVMCAGAELSNIDLEKLIDQFSTQVMEDTKKFYSKEKSIDEKVKEWKHAIDSVARFIHVSKLGSCIPNPSLLSAVIHLMGMKIGGCKVSNDQESIICQTHGVSKNQLNRAERQFRHQLLKLGQNIPGVSPNVNIRSILNFFPCLQAYYQNIQALEETGGTGFQENVSTCEESEIGHLQEQSYVPERRHVEKLNARIRIVSDVKGESRASDRKAKRRRGFASFLEEINQKRRASGEDELSVFYGTSEIMNRGKTIGYLHSLPLKPQTGTLTEIRRGSLHASIEKTKPLCPKPAPLIKKEKLDESESAVEFNLSDDPELDEFILSPREVVLKRLALDM